MNYATTPRRTFLAGAGLALAAAKLPAATATPVTQGQPMKKIIIAADPFAITLKDAIVKHLKDKGYEVADFTTCEGKDTPYYVSAVAACKALQAKQAERAILLCGTGMGMNCIANRFKGITAGVVESVFAAKMARAINDANVLCLGAMIWGEFMALQAVDTFLATKHTEGLEQFAPFLKEACCKVAEINPN